MIGTTEQALDRYLDAIEGIHQVWEYVRKHSANEKENEQ